jgi:hypothetical protein
VLAIWRTRVRVVDSGGSWAHDVITPLLASGVVWPRSHQLAGLLEGMRQRLDLIARAAIEGWDERERAFRARAATRAAAIRGAIDVLRRGREEVQTELFGEIAAEREQGGGLAGTLLAAPSEPRAEGWAAAVVEHGLLLVLSIR